MKSNPSVIVISAAHCAVLAKTFDELVDVLEHKCLSADFVFRGKCLRAYVFPSKTAAKQAFRELYAVALYQLRDRVSFAGFVSSLYFGCSKFSCKVQSLYDFYLSYPHFK